MNDEGSDTVFHAQNTVSKSLHDHYIYTQRHSRSASLGSRYYYFFLIEKRQLWVRPIDRKIKNVSCEYNRLIGWNSIIKIKIHPTSCDIEDFVETHLCKLCVILRSHVLYYGIRRVVEQAGLVRACQLLRREHAANIWPSLCWPWMLGWVETSRNALETSIRGQTRGSVWVGSDLSIEIYMM